MNLYNNGRASPAVTPSRKASAHRPHRAMAGSLRSFLTISTFYNNQSVKEMALPAEALREGLVFVYPGLPTRQTTTDNLRFFLPISYSGHP